MYYLFYSGPQWTSCIIAFGSTFALHFQIANAILSFRQVYAFSGSFANTHSTLRKIRSNQTKLCFVMVLVLAKFINSSLNFLPRLQVIRFVLISQNSRSLFRRYFGVPLRFSLQKIQKNKRGNN